MKWGGQEINKTYSWYRVISILWIVIIALQWVNFTESMWFMQTTTLVAVTLISIAAISALPLPNIWSWILKSLAVVISWWIVLITYEVYVPTGNFFPDQLIGMAAHLSPYIWFSLVTWGLFELIWRLVRERLHILMLLGVIMIAFTILDSFTPYKCWHNVAWTVFAGLGWLSSHHFRKYQLKYPLGWKSLRRQPIKVLLNVSVIVACVILIGISVPSVTPLLTDPYTAWKNRGGGEGGSSATVAASNTEGIQYIAPENVVSGYSRDDSTLGEGFEFLYSPVMSVQTPIRSYWRGETRRIYTGAGWDSLEQEERGYMLHSGASTGEMVTEEFPKIKTQRVEQIVTMETDRPYPVLFGAYTIRSVEIIKKEDEDIPAPQLRWASREAELHFGDSDLALLDSSEANIYPKRYKVVSDVPLIPLEEVQKASYEDLYSNTQNSDYLQIPNTFPQRVKDLAEEVTASGATPYKKMELLQSYLRQNYEYTNKPDLSRKQSEDFVDGFLFEIKQGYCDYYSTAMVMMARSLGIPARWVKGYAPGTLPASDFMQQRMTASESGSYRVNNADSHSWAELYFGEYGWITFEATPGFDAPLLYWDEDGSVVSTGADQQLDELEAGEFQGFAWLNSTVLRTITIISIIIVVLAAAYWLRSAIYFGIFRLRKGRSLTPGEKAVYETMRVVHRLKRRGLSRNDSETLRESFNRWRIEKPELSAMLDSLLAQFERASYSHYSFTTQQWRDVQTLSRQIFKVTRKRVEKK